MPSPELHIKILLTEQAASEVVGFKVATLRKRRWQGLPPRFLKVGSKVFYDRQDLQEFLNTCIQHSTSETSKGAK